MTTAKKLHLSLFFIFSLFLPCFAQNSISGKIQSEQTKENLVGVSVYVNDLKIGVVSDKDGFYQIENLKTGTYLIEVSFLGYRTLIEQHIINEHKTINFSLSDAAKELTEVVVTGVARSTELKKSPVIIKSINKATLQNNSTNLIDALKNIPGVSQITTGAAISKPVIRGLGYNRVISLYNGIRQEGQQWGDEHGIEIDEYAIDKIEIVKGPGSLMYGSDGIAGVLNFISPKAPLLGEVKTQVISNYQSNNALWAYSVANSGNKNGIQWASRWSNKYASNYQNKYDGKVYNAGFKEYNANIFLGINKNWGYTHWHINSFNSNINLPEGDRDDFGNFIYVDTDGNEKTTNHNDLNGYKLGFPHQNINHLQIASNNYFVLKKGSINFDIGFQNNKRKEFGDVANPKNIDLFFDLNTINYNLRYHLPETKGWERSIGLGGMLQNNKNKGLEFLIPAYSLFDVGGFVFGQKTFQDKLTFATGFRIDKRQINSKQLILDELGQSTDIEGQGNEIKFRAFKKTYTGFSGSAGLSYQANTYTTLKLNLSSGFRSPTIAELASNGRHEGTFRYEIGSTILKPELSKQIDIAYLLNTDHVTFEVTPFSNFISNYIYAEKLIDDKGNEIIPDLKDPAPAFQFTQTNAALFGAELYLDIHPHPLDWLHIENSFSFVQGQKSKASDSTKFLPFMPAPKYRAELKADFKKVGNQLSKAYLRFYVDYFFKQDKYFSAYQTETATPAYTLLGAGMGANLKAFGKKDFMSISINAENLTNLAYQDHLNRLKYAPFNRATGRSGIYNMGRNISTKLIVNL